MTARDESRSAPESREVEASYRRGAIRRWWTLSGLSGAASAGRKALAATAFVETMRMRLSHVAGREVPSGFTMESQPAAVALFDALTALSLSPAPEQEKP